MAIETGLEGRDVEFAEVIGESAAMREVLETVRRVGPSRCGVLVCGERGTGRETVARAIHACGDASNGAFVRVDCATTSPQDLERELFGTESLVERDGLSERRTTERIATSGRLFEARGGTLFLENITEMSSRVQARFARVIRDREAVVAGETHQPKSKQPVDLDIRPIAAVEPSFEVAMRDGRLRSDLCERLSAVRINVPPLRHRREDVPLLASHFLNEICIARSLPSKTLTRSALTLLTALPWRGNARELRDLLTRLAILASQHVVRLEDVLAHVRLDGALSASGPAVTLREARMRFERDYIAAVLQQHHGRVAEAAKALGIQRTNLYRKVRQLKVLRPKVRSRDA
jgi:DNA-binding NtrC family response regulator